MVPVTFYERASGEVRRALIVWAQLAEGAAEEFELNLQELRFVKTANSRIMGLCSSEGAVTINIGLHPSFLRGEPDWEASVTLAHELAHLRVFDHNPAHNKLTRDIKRWLDRNGGRSL